MVDSWLVAHAIPPGITTTLHNVREEYSDEEEDDHRSGAMCKKSPNVYKSCPKMIPLEKWKILTTLQKLSNTYVGDLGKIIVAKGFEKLPKVQ